MQQCNSNRFARSDYVSVPPDPSRAPPPRSYDSNKAMFILDPNPTSMDLAGKRVMVCEYPDGRGDIQHEGQSLPSRRFDKIRPVSPPAVVGNDRLGATLAMARIMQEAFPL